MVLWDLESARLEYSDWDRDRDRLRCLRWVDSKVANSVAVAEVH